MYERILDRNENSIFLRLQELIELNQDYLPDDKVKNVDEDETIKALHDLYRQATDMHNPDRDMFMMSDEMYGNLNSDLQSYDLRHNPKYKSVEFLISELDESFGLTNRLIHDLQMELGTGTVDMNLMNLDDDS